MPYRDLSDGQILAAATGFAAICGWLSYLLKVQEERLSHGESFCFMVRSVLYVD